MLNSILRISVVLLLIVGAFQLGFYYGCNAGFITLGKIAGPALLRCVELLPIGGRK